MNAELPRIGNPVEYLTHEGDGGDIETWTYLGKVMGFGTSNGEPVAIVYLEDRAAYLEGRKHFVTNLVVHLSNIRPCRVAVDEGV